MQVNIPDGPKPGTVATGAVAAGTNPAHGVLRVLPAAIRGSLSSRHTEMVPERPSLARIWPDAAALEPHVFQATEEGGGVTFSGPFQRHLELTGFQTTRDARRPAPGTALLRHLELVMFQATTAQAT